MRLGSLGSPGSTIAMALVAAGLVAPAATSAAGERTPEPPRWPRALTVAAAPAVGDVSVDDRYIDTDHGNGDRAVWTSDESGTSSLWTSEGPRLGKVRRVSWGPARPGSVAVSRTMVVWQDSVQQRLRGLSIYVDGGQGTSYEGTVRVAIPGTEGLAAPVVPAVSPDLHDHPGAVLWPLQRPDGTAELRAVGYAWDSMPYDGPTFSTATTAAAIAGVTIDQVVALTQKQRVVVAFRATDAQGLRSLQLVTGTWRDDRFAWSAPRPVCAEPAAVAGPTCSSPRLDQDSAGAAHLFYLEQVGTSPALRHRPVGAVGAAAPTTLGPAAQGYAVHGASWQGTDLAAAAADGTTVTLWTWSVATGRFRPVRIATTDVPLESVAVSSRGKADLVLWRTSDDVLRAVRVTGARASAAAVVPTGGAPLLSAGLSAAGALPAAWWVDGAGGRQRLRVSEIDDQGPVTLTWGLSRVKRARHRMRADFTSEDAGGLRRAVIQLRSGRPGHLGRWQVVKRVRLRGRTEAGLTYRFPVRKGIRYCARARAVDRSGNRGSWSLPTADDVSVFIKTCRTVRR